MISLKEQPNSSVGGGFDSGLFFDERSRISSNAASIFSIVARDSWEDAHSRPPENEKSLSAVFASKSPRHATTPYFFSPTLASNPPLFSDRSTQDHPLPSA